MGRTVSLPPDGVCRWIRFNALNWRLRISLRKQGGRSGSSVGSALWQNKTGYVVRGDPPQITTGAPTSAVPPLESMSR